MKHQSLIFSLYEIGAIQVGQFTLKSGESTSVYINLRKIISYPYLMNLVTEVIWEETQHLQFDLVCGVPYAALPIATSLSLAHQIPMIMCRKERKDYGTKQMIEGVFNKGQTCLLVEDVITAGASMMETADELENHGLVVNDVVALVDREQGGKQNLEKKYRTHIILTISDMLQTLLQSTLLTAHERHILEEFLKTRFA